MSRLLAITGAGLAAGVLALALAPPAAPHAGRVLSSGGGPPAPAQPRPHGCPALPDPGALPPARELLADNAVMAQLGRRPTGSAAHEQWIAWLDARLREVPGVQVGSVAYGIDRWLERDAALRAGGQDVRVAGAVPYSRPTTGATGQLVEVAGGTPISAVDVRGKVVVRDAATASIPKAVFAALEWWTHDPKNELITSVLGTYERDYLAYEARLADLRQAAAGGAAGLILVHDFPHEQVAGHYAPYEGERWDVPAVQVGAEEGARLRRLAAERASATLEVGAREGLTATRSLVATLPGVSDERIVLTSHTDGMNAVWDNGPVGMLAMLRHLATVPERCRPRTVQLVMTTAHLFQQLAPGARGGSAEQLAAELDAGYDAGRAVFALALEHMGAREYEARPRAGRPGRELVPTGRGEPTSIFIGESPLLVAAMLASTIRADVPSTLALRGADLPALRIPPHRNFGGEGGAYQEHLVPTVALVTGPWSLYNPAFGMEAIDGELLRRQVVAFTDLVYRVWDTPKELLAGAYLGYRAARDVFCRSAFSTLGVADCEPTPEAPGPPARSVPAHCSSRRVFRIRLPEPRGRARIRSARVTVAGRRVSVRRGRRWTARVDLRGMSRRTATVRVAVRTTAGRVLRETRRYRLCVARGAR